MSQSDETDAADSELITEARAETGRPGGLAGPVGESTDDDGIGAASSGAPRHQPDRGRCGATATS